jgi:phospholipid/cholesterol/gamma-HCH transport system ATP-binding protein
MIAFREVYKRFGSKEVLRGFSLEVQDGETMVIIGTSGSGKSVALKHVVGLLAPDQGQVEVDGNIVHMLEWDDLMA